VIISRDLSSWQKNELVCSTGHIALLSYIFHNFQDYIYSPTISSTSFFVLHYSLLPSREIQTRRTRPDSIGGWARADMIVSIQPELLHKLLDLIRSACIEFFPGHRHRSHYLILLLVVRHFNQNFSSEKPALWMDETKEVTSYKALEISSHSRLSSSSSASSAYGVDVEPINTNS
jgi:hypothetical protein